MHVLRWIEEGESIRVARYSDAGFTLIELMVTVSVVAILAMVAAPAMTSIINSNRLAGQTNDIVATLQFARSEAVRRNASVTVCGSADGLACGGGWSSWLVVDASDNVLQTGLGKPPVEVSVDPVATTSITYRPDGFTDAATITACIETTKPAENRRVVSLTAAGQVSTAKVDGQGSCP